MKLLIVYHAGAMLNARRIYRALVDAGPIELTVVVPERLKVDTVYDSKGWLCLERSENWEGYQMVPVPLRSPTSYAHGFEVGGLGPVVKRIKPDIIHVLDEPTSGYLSQVVQQRFRVSRHSRVVFYGFHNLPLQLTLRSRLAWRLRWSLMAGGVAANCEALKNLREAGFPRRRPLERIFWGIPTDVFKPMNGDSVKQDRKSVV